VRVKSLGETGAAREAGEQGAVRVRFYGERRDEHHVGHLRIVETRGDGDCHIPLAWGQGAEPIMQRRIYNRRFLLGDLTDDRGRSG
jgi:hypothetical protein